MPKLLKLLFILCFCVLFTTSAKAELLVNGNFKGGQIGWTKWGPNAYVVSTSGYYKDSASGVLYWSDAGWYQQVTALPGQSFIASGEMIYPSAHPLVARNAYIRAVFYDASSQQIGYADIGALTPSHTANQWYSFSQMITAPENSSKMRIVLLTYDASGANGWAYFDNIRLNAVVVPKGPDYNGDGSIDFLDLAEMSNYWLQTDASHDLDGVSLVDINDFIIFAREWNRNIPQYPGYYFVWSDEFDRNSIDSTNWTNQVMGDGGNQELQYYTNRPINSRVENGNLIIQSQREDYVVNGTTYKFTSARLRTYGKRDFLYGRIEARIKLPKGTGMWPAFWMMPTDNIYGGWAASGEMDIMESSNQMTFAGGTIHYGGQWPDNVYSGGTINGSDFSQDYHVYSMVWKPNEIKWYLDGLNYCTRTSWWSSDGSFPAPFNQRFHIILNTAVGGTYTGILNWQQVTTNLPQKMYIDWVRVYQQN